VLLNLQILVQKYLISFLLHLNTFKSFKYYLKRYRDIRTFNCIIHYIERVICCNNPNYINSNYMIYIRSYQFYIYIYIINFDRVFSVFFRYQVIDSIIYQPVISIIIFVLSFGLSKLKHTSISHFYFL
jgi:hypothetical protein